MIELLKSTLLGIIEGVTEWLPVSSTGHMILFNEILGLSDSFFGTDVFIYVIQLGAILAIATLYFNKLNPFSRAKSLGEKKETFTMWWKVILACLPAVVAGLLLDDYMKTFENSYVISAALIFYGIAFIIIENRKKEPFVNTIKELSYKKALLIGAFQVLSIVPGTSRSGATILGAIILGLSRPVAAEFSFFLAIPVMFGASFLKIGSYIWDLYNGVEGIYIISKFDWMLLLAGMVIAYVVSLFSAKFLTQYVKKHNFKIFGVYRIILGIIVLLSAFFIFK